MLPKFFLWKSSFPSSYSLIFHPLIFIREPVTSVCLVFFFFLSIGLEWLGFLLVNAWYTRWPVVQVDLWKLFVSRSSLYFVRVLINSVWLMVLPVWAYLLGLCPSWYSQVWKVRFVQVELEQFNHTSLCTHIWAVATMSWICRPLYPSTRCQTLSIEWCSGPWDPGPCSFCSCSHWVLWAC